MLVNVSKPGFGAGAISLKPVGIFELSVAMGKVLCYLTVGTSNYYVAV